MPIIHMATNEAEARKLGGDTARSYTTQVRGSDGELKDHIGWTYETHHGLCIKEMERNGYHDSDFLMLLWDPEKQEAKWYEFASTRGWSYPCYGSAADATPETLKAYHDWEHRREVAHRASTRSAAAQRLRTARESARAVAQALGVPSGRLTALRHKAGRANSWRLAQLEAVLHLMTANLRSPFKLKLRAQVEAWLAEESPRYPTPLSPRQMEYLKYPNGDEVFAPPAKLK